MRAMAYRVLSGLGLTLLIWILVLAWWQSNDHQPSSADLLLYLVAVPGALIAGYWLLRGVIEQLKAPPLALSPAPLVPDDDPLSGARAISTATERGFSLFLVDAWVHVAAGNSADDIVAAVEAGSRPGPSEEIMDDAGFPVFAAEVKDIDVDGMNEQLLRDGKDIHPALAIPAILRSIVLLDGVMAAAMDRAKEIMESAGEKISLQVFWLLPGDWDPAHRDALRGWFEKTCGAGHFASTHDVHLISVASEADAMKQLDELILRANRSLPDKTLMLIAGAVSAVDEQVVARWSSRQGLFSAGHQQGQIPGEGAVALLLAERNAVEFLRLEDVAEVSRVMLGARDKRLDAGGRISGRLVEQLLAGLLDSSGLEGESIKAVVLDTDHRVGHVAEAMEGVLGSLPHLDPVSDFLATGSACGALDPIGSLVALACARTKVLAGQSPVICLSNQHALERAMLIVSPFVASDKTEPRIS